MSYTRGRRQLHCLSSGLVADLEAYLELSRPHLAREGENALFVSQRGSRLSDMAIRHLVAQCASEAGVRRP